MPRRRKKAAPQTAGPHVAAFLKEYVRQTKGRWARTPLVLEPWQQDFVDEAFELDEHGVRVYQDVVLGIPRKNGKSTLVSGLGIYLLVADGENSPEVYAGAGSKDQAGAVFNQASTMVRRSPELADILRVQRSVIDAPFNDGFFKVVASDGDLQHGTNPSGTLLDELWAHKNGKLHTALTSGSGARDQPFNVAITTAGYDMEAEPLGPIYARAMELPDVEARRDGFLHICRDKENGFLMVWYGPPAGNADIDFDDPKVWEACNPASWITPRYLGKQRRKPSMRENDFRRFHTNQWTEAEEAWITPKDWDSCKGEVLVEDAEECYTGIDFAQKRDHAAIITVGWIGDELHVRADIKIPTKSKIVTHGDVELLVIELAREMPIEEIPYDPARFGDTAEKLEERGFTMVEFPQTDARMGPASERLYKLIVEGKLVHNGHPILRSHILAAVASKTERGWRLSKRKSKKQIDGAVALAMAADRAEFGRNNNTEENLEWL